MKFVRNPLSPVFPDFVVQRRGGATIWIDHRCADRAFVDRLANPDELFADPGCEIIKDQKKIKVGRVRMLIAGKARSLYVKRYNAFSMRYRLVSPFVASGAYRALRGAAILRSAGILTAAPVAAVEHRRSRALSKSFFISEEVAGGKTADDFWNKPLAELTGREGIRLRRRFLSELAALFCSLHAQQIYHNDLKDANILVVSGRSDLRFGFFLLDLEGVRRVPCLSAKRKIKNLVQLQRTLGRYLRVTDQLFFLKHYLGAEFTDRETQRHWIASVMSESRRLDDIKGRMNKAVAKSNPVHDA